MTYYNTLNEALTATDEKLVALYPVGYNLRYGETIRFVKDGIFVSVYRDERGMYEEAISYESKCKDFVSVIQETEYVTYF